jgi:hypothetical protein
MDIYDDLCQPALDLFNRISKQIKDAPEGTKQIQWIDGLGQVSIGYQEPCKQWHVQVSLSPTVEETRGVKPDRVSDDLVKAFDRQGKEDYGLIFQGELLVIFTVKLK